MDREKINATPMILFYLFLNLFLFALLLWILDISGMIAIKENRFLGYVSSAVNKVLRKNAIKIVDDEDLFLLSELRITKKEEALQSKISDFNVQKSDFEREKQSIIIQLSELEKGQQDLKDKEDSLKNKLDNMYSRETAFKEISKNLTNMAPEAAIQILINHTDQDVIDILRVTEEEAAKNKKTSLVPLWISLLPPDRAAVIQRKMAVRPSAEAEF